MDVISNCGYLSLFKASYKNRVTDESLTPTAAGQCHIYVSAHLDSAQLLSLHICP